MKLSIIIPTFNSSKVIGRALDSIVAQTFGDWEVLVMDGASKDNTGEIVKSYNDERIKFYSEPDKGIYDAMNKGIKKAQGEWLYFLGSDDWLLNNGVLKNVFEQNISSFDVVYGEAEYEHLPESFHGEWSKQNIGTNRCHQAIFYTRNILIRLGGYNLKYASWADYDVNLKWFLNRKIKKSYIGTYIAHFSFGGFSDGHPDVIFEKDKEKLYLRYGFYFWTLAQRVNFTMKALAKEDSSLVRAGLRFLSYYLRLEYKFARLFRIA